ncbi:MAG: hypothetical protein ACLR2E_04705 [Lachnospiraceae bacterium]
MDFIQIPTTLLAQVDSSIGGKPAWISTVTRIWWELSIIPPWFSANLSTLKTLTAEQFACGMGEVLKHGLIKNASYYEWCINQMFEIQDREVEALKTMVLESMKIKKLL